MHKSLFVRKKENLQMVPELKFQFTVNKANMNYYKTP